MQSLAYILSHSYSGSTLLTFLLAAHPEIATIGELKATQMGDVDKYHCSCGKLIRECQFWKELTELLRAQGVPFDVAHFGTHFRYDKGVLGDRIMRCRVRGTAFEAMRTLCLGAVPTWRVHMQSVLNRNQALAEAIARIQGGSVFLDGSKDAVRLKYFLDEERWNVRTIYLVRDGRGASNSYMRHHEVSMETAAAEWRIMHEEYQGLMGLLPETERMPVRYEDLCRDIEGTMGRIWRFLGLDPIDGEGNSRTGEQHILGNAMRLRAGEKIKLDEKWRSSLSRAELRAFERIAGRVNRLYGYE